MGGSICWAAYKADIQFMLFNLSELKKQCLISGPSATAAAKGGEGGLLDSGNIMYKHNLKQLEFEIFNLFFDGRSL